MEFQTINNPDNMIVINIVVKNRRFLIAEFSKSYQTVDGTLEVSYALGMNCIYLFEIGIKVEETSYKIDFKSITGFCYNKLR